MASKHHSLTFSHRTRVFRAIMALGFVWIFFSGARAQRVDDPAFNTEGPAWSHYLQVKMDNGGLCPVKDSLGQNRLGNWYYRGLDLRLAFRKKKNDNVYNDIYRGPSFGVGYFLSSFKNGVVGNPMAIYGFTEIPFGRPGRSRWEWLYSIGLGLSFHFDPYDPVRNPANIFIGTRKNVYINLTLEGRYHISDRFSLGAGIGYKHFSNGAVRMPNKGLNMVPIVVSAQYKLEPGKDSWKPFIRPRFVPYYILDLYGIFGTRTYDYTNRHYLKMAVGATALRQVAYRYRVGIGFDLFYTEGGKDRVRKVESDFRKNFSYAVYGAWEWVINEKLSMPIHLAFYLHHNKDNEEKEFFYQRIGMRYKVNTHLITGLSLKANAGAADFIEFTLGYSFHNHGFGMAGARP
jgi:hypothetical protein